MICNIQWQSKQWINELIKNLAGLIIFLFSSPIFAANSHIYFGGTLGSSMVKVGNNNPQINYDGGILTDAYPIHKRQANTTLMSINGGYEFSGIGLRPAIALGLSIFGTPGDYNYRGKVIETATGDPGSTLYHYKYHVHSTRLTFESQFTWTFLKKFASFINLGIGPALNRLSGYTESSVESPGCVALPPPFQSYTNIYFSYQIGLGASYAFHLKPEESDHLDERISLGYRYVNLGDASFGTRGAVYPYYLDIGRLTSNEVFLGYTHLF
ncbi:Uncharacterised protein [Legionella wadsworthii]|uniref:Opacity protein and related surface antigens n=1 Tax=Legionella wadsworthii TaxID=28088 RepID=A0A378LST6_9GAMM|nr:hypothetical protein [Legionella wadsworthii]STY29804.1 Uncharacterised protein [Legionella wadsworthii]